MVFTRAKKYLEEVLKILGFSNPRIVDLEPFSEIALKLRPSAESRSKSVYDVRAALDSYGAGPNCPTYLPSSS